MTDSHLVDLRKPDTQSVRRDATIETTYASRVPPAPQLRDTIPGAILTWNAVEHEKRESGPRWYAALIGGAALLVILGVLTKSYLFIAFVVLAMLVIILYKKRGPHEFACAITGQGILTGKRFYAFSQFKSFQVDDTEDVRELSLETARGIMPYLKIPLGTMRPEPVRRVLVRFLPEQEHKKLMSDQIARVLGL